MQCCAALSGECKESYRRVERAGTVDFVFEPSFGTPMLSPVAASLALRTAPGWDVGQKFTREMQCGPE